MKPVQRLAYALSLLTIFPARLSTPPTAGDTGRAAIWFPWVGLLIGLLVALARLALGTILPPLVTAAACLMIWAGVTGGLHLDGLADCCDGLFHPSSPQRRLEIMQDPHLGSFGASGLMLVLLLKAAALVSLRPGLNGGLAIVLAAVLGRWLVLLAGKQPMARPGGMGAELALGLNWSTVLAGAILPAILTLAGGLRGILACGLGLLISAGLFALARRRLGGLTGDVFGATIELAELAVLVAFCLNPNFP